MLGERMAQSLPRREGRLFPSKPIDDTSSTAVSIDSEPISRGKGRLFESIADMDSVYTTTPSS